MLLLLLGSANAQHHLLLHAQDARGRWYDLESAHGRMVVVTFGSRGMEKDARLINDELARYGGPDTVVLSVVDLREVPSIARKLALRRVRQSDRRNLHHLLDTRGQIARDFGADPRHHVDMFVVDRNGELLGHYVGTQQLPDVEAQLAKAGVRHL